MWHETEEFRNFNVFKNIYAAKQNLNAIIYPCLIQLLICVLKL